jgi:hypothetical protein
MAKQKTRFQWKPADVKKLVAMADDDKLVSKLVAMAERLGVSYRKAYDKWAYEVTKLSKKKNAPKVKAGDIEPMILDFDEDFTLKGGGFIDPKEIKAFQKGLELNIDKLTPGKGAITVSRRFEKITKEYVAKHHTAKLFVLQKIEDNPDARRLVRKA